MEFLFQTQLKTRAAYILNCLCYCSYGDCNLSFCFYFWVKPIPFCLLHVCAVLHVGYCQDLGGRRAATSSSPCLEIRGRFSFFMCQSPTPLLIVCSTGCILLLHSVGISLGNISKFGYERDCFGKLEA